MVLFTIESEQAEEAKQKKLDNTKPPEPSTPDYAAGLTPMTQPTKVYEPFKCSKMSIYTKVLIKPVG